jgi:ADP-dependent NAD(P)H-hydrate dehydratase
MSSANPRHEVTLPPALPKLAKRDPNSHKGSYGHALFVGGSRGMCGSVALSGMAAIASGAGLTTLAVPDRFLETVAGYSPCYMTKPLKDNADGQLDASAWTQLSGDLSRYACVGLGPGLGRSRSIDEFVFHFYQDCAVPLVIDADGLYALASTNSATSRVKYARIWTPHPGEFQTLTGISSTDRPSQIACAIEWAGKYGVVIVLKGNRTLVTDGQSSYYNETGNAAMATGGSGDCLTGIIVALVCQGLTAIEAAKLGVYLHGLAGDLAHKRLGGHVVPPTELIHSIPAAFSSLE